MAETAGARLDRLTVVVSLVAVSVAVGLDGQGGGQAVLVSGHGAFDRLGQVGSDVPAIGDLGRVRCAVAGAVGVGTGAVAADDLDAGMDVQPLGQGRRGAVVSTSIGLWDSRSTSSVP